MRLILIIAWFFAEAWSISAASDQLGGLPVFVLLLLIAAAGTRLIQRQGFRTVANIQEAMQRNELPAVAMLDGLIVFIAGVLLVVPGFISDGLALVLLFGGIRRRVARRVEAFIARQHPEYQGVVIIEGEFHRVSEADTPASPKPPERIGHDDER